MNEKLDAAISNLTIASKSLRDVVKEMLDAGGSIGNIQKVFQQAVSVDERIVALKTLKQQLLPQVIPPAK